MTQSAPGWYPEPDPNYAGPPGRLRFWDGGRWTDQVQDQAPAGLPGPPPPSFPGYPAPPGQPVPAPAGARASTPDGQPLAGWWQRVLAAVLDVFIALPLTLVAALPAIIWQWQDLSDWFDASVDSIEDGSSSPPVPDLLDPTSTPGLVLVLSTLLASALYAVVFLAWKQATPGKLVVGLRVRRRDTPGPLPFGTVLARVGVVTALSLATQFFALAFLLALLNYLWPLWDKKKQAWHDKAAGTNVVRLR